MVPGRCNTVGKAIPHLFAGLEGATLSRVEKAVLFSGQPDFSGFLQYCRIKANGGAARLSSGIAPAFGFQVFSDFRFRGVSVDSADLVQVGDSV